VHAKFHLDPSNRLATVHERHRQTGQTGQRPDSIGRTVLQTVAQKRGSTSVIITLENSFFFGRPFVNGSPYAIGPLSDYPVLFCAVCPVLFVTLVYCDKTVGWIKMPLGMEVDFGSRPRPRRHCVRWGPSSPQKGHSPPLFGPCLLWPNPKRLNGE